MAQLIYLEKQFVLYPPSVPTPMVTVVSDPPNPRVGDSATLTCTIVPVKEPAVDTAVIVTAEWTGPEGALTGTDPTMTSTGTYESMLTLTSLPDSGVYTCAAGVNPDGTPFVIASALVSGSVTAGKSIEFTHNNPHNISSPSRPQSFRNGHIHAAP